MKRLTNLSRLASRFPWVCGVPLLFLLIALPGVPGVPGVPGAWAVPGDIAGGSNGDPDGLVGIEDLNAVLGHWNQTCDPGDWTKGDITGDGFVGTEDLNVVLGHWNQRDPDPFLGTNLGPLGYWRPHWAFVDVMKMARPWLSSGGDVGVDSDGWPTSNPGGQTVYTYVFADLDGYPGGDYVLTWDGTADVTAVNDVSAVTTDPGNPRRKIVTVSPGSGGIRININNIDPGDPIKNIRLWMPGFEDAQSPFHPLFLSRLRPFKVLRFMDWQKINDSVEVQWTDRKQPSYAFQNDKRGDPAGNPGGVALEYIVQLCNELEADPWFCMPHQADDDYVMQFAQYVKNYLHEDATIYLEYSNELWNQDPRFNQWEWLEEQATTRTGTEVHIRDNEWFEQWALEAARDFQIWHTVFKDTSPIDSRKIVRVVAGHKENVWILKKVLERDGLKDPDDPTGKDVLFDAVACSTYLLDRVDGYDAQAPTTEQKADSILFHTIHRTITQYDTSDPDDPDPPANDPNNTDFYLDHAGWSDFYSTQTGRPIALLSYEGGQHFVRIRGGSRDNTHVPTDVLLALQRRPMMYKAYIDNIKAFKDAGGSLFMAFNSVGKFTEDDTFGHFEFQDESIHEAPKHRAVIGGGGR